MRTFDWIVIGNGLAGAALSYELATQGLQVLLVDRTAQPDSGTRHSYGGVAYWAGTTSLTRQLCQETRQKHRHLSDELGADTEFRELDLLLTYPPDQVVADLALQFAQCESPPQPISLSTAQELEPLLVGEGVGGAFTVRHGHVCPRSLVKAYNHGFHRRGGTMMVAPVTGLVRVKDRVTGITTATQAYAAQRVAVAAGAYSLPLLRQVGVALPLYFTHGEVLETPPLDHLTLRTKIMPAHTQRYDLEAAATAPHNQQRWQQPDQEIVPPILDSGAIQFQDGRLCIGQISRTLSNLDHTSDTAASEAQLRQAIGQILPALQDLPGRWRHCQVSFSADGLPLVGAVPGLEGVELFVGFSSPFALLPPLAERFAQAIVGEDDPLLAALTLDRFQPEQAGPTEALT